METKWKIIAKAKSKRNEKADSEQEWEPKAEETSSKEEDV
jgi:hypothetical protein